MQSSHERARTIDAATHLTEVLQSASRGEAMTEGRSLVDALVDAARALDEAGVRYALIGGFAVGLHARPRATVDVDLAVVMTNRQQAIEALTARRYELRAAFAHSVNFRHANGTPVQLTFDDSLDEMIGRAQTAEIAETPVRVLTREDLIASKERAAADPSRRRSKALQDLADVARLKGDDPDPDEGW